MELLKRMASEGSCERSCDESADMYLMLARRARTSGLLEEDVQDGETWCGVLSRRLIEDSLHSSHSQVRLGMGGVCDKID